MKSREVVCLVAVALGIGMVSAQLRESIQGPTELIAMDSSKAYIGYTLFGARGTSYLIDVQGKIVRKWAIGQNPRLLAYNGNILDGTKQNNYEGFKELDWDGNLKWEYYETRTGYAPHHDWVRIYNKKLKAHTTLYIANKTLTNAQALAAGCDSANAPYDGAQMDAIVEVDSLNNIVWEWWFFDHVVQDLYPSKPTYGVIKNTPGKIDLNLPGRPVRQDWLHCNSIDYNEALGHIVTNSVQGEFYVINHDATFIPGNLDSSITLAASSLGDFLYRFGDPARYEQGNPPSISTDWTKSTTGHKQIGGSHDIQWIAPGLPGEGHFLVFNNGQYLFEMTPQSYIFEINPYLNSSLTNTGNYVNPPTAGYYVWDYPDKNAMKSKKNMSNQIVWMYYALSNQNFFSQIGSSAQRLPNGNTLICAMTEGHIFEVTAGTTSTRPEVVWEYINPVTNDGILKWIKDPPPMYNSIFRAYRYGPDFPGFVGKDMTPGKKITEQIVEIVQEERFCVQNYPNPFTTRTTIVFNNISDKAMVKIYNCAGKELVSKVISGNRYVWDAKDYVSGLYVVKVIANNKSVKKHMCLIK